MLSIAKDKVIKAIEFAEEHEFTNEQWFIDWEIDISNLATKDHNNIS